ncbi:MAG: nicotinate-nucleotide adenylyltransferase [Thermodesulfobacteriota bacterium]|nr:nicotinate-nucleotide adenylyltransferase [Thermodesulfobacteriota bacterium]
MRKGPRIGLLGGTFDPVHLGHLAVAETVLTRLQLNRMLFIPAARPPHKTDFSITPFSQRAAMLKLALVPFPRYELSLLEEDRSGLSFSIDTLRELRRSFGGEARFFFITGFDAFAEINSWKEWDHLLDLTAIVVIDRPSHDGGNMDELVNRLFPGYREGAAGVWSAETGENIYSLGMEPVSISSTEIRRRIQAGESVASLVSSDVEEYIRDHGLYLNS